MAPLECAEQGSVSTGTLDITDLLATFADTLERLIQSNADHWTGRKDLRDKYTLLVWDTRELADDADEEYLLVELISALDYFSPADHYFGAHPGDGADFGYWPND